MKLIIDPHTLYMWSVLDELRNVSVSGLALFAIVAIVLGIGYITLTASDSWEHETSKTAMYNWIIISLIATGLFVLGVIFIPSKELMVEMTIGKLVADENTSFTIDQLKELAEYITKLMK